MMLTNILCPVDFSNCSRRALQVGLAVVHWTGAHMKVINVGPAVMLYPALVTRVTPAVVATPTRAERAARVARFLQPLVNLHWPIDVILEEGEAAGMIVGAVRPHAIDLIVMGTHGRGGFGRLRFGSVTQEVLRGASCPVLVVPPGPAPLPSFHGFRRILCSAPAASVEYAHLLFERESAQITTLPATEPYEGIVQAASEAKPDLIVWNREGDAIDVLIRRAAVPVLSVSVASPTRDCTPLAGRAMRCPDVVACPDSSGRLQTLR